MLRTLAPYLAYGYLTLVKWTTRLSILGEEHRRALHARNQRCILAFWHQRQVFFTCTHRNDQTSVLVSLSRDGEIIAHTMRLSKIRATRGSSSRGSVASLREMLELVEQGYDLGITPDGPKGPARAVKPGAIYLAQKLGIPIIPITNALSHQITLKKSWDHFQVPLPFGRAAVVYGEPITVSEQDDVQAKAKELEESLNTITDQADQLINS